MLPDGGAVCDLRLAVNGSRDAQPLFIDIATFGRHAEACAQYLAKGREIAFTGRLVYAEWAGRDGIKRSKHSAVGQVEFRGSRSARPAAADDPPSPRSRRRRSAGARARRELDPCRARSPSRTGSTIALGPRIAGDAVSHRALRRRATRIVRRAALQVRQGMRQSFINASDPEAVEHMIADGAPMTDVFVGVLPRRRRGGCRDDLVPNGSVVWVDCDATSSSEAVRRFPLAPSVIVESGAPGHHRLTQKLRNPSTSSVVAVAREDSTAAHRLRHSPTTSGTLRACYHELAYDSMTV